MGLFGGYQNAGPGINPNAPKKKPFFRFWEVLWRNIGKLLTLNLVYTLFHAPMLLSMIFYMETNNKLTVPMVIFLLVVQVILVGPTMAGCARVLRLIVLDKAFFFFEEFKKGFKNNFGAALLFWLVDLLVILSVISGYWVYPQLAPQLGKGVYIMFGVSLAIALILLFMNYYLLPLQVSTKLSKSSTIKNSFMLSVIALKQCVITTICVVAMVGVTGLLIWINSVFMFVAAFFPAAFVGYTVMFINYPVIQKYVINPYYEQTGEANPESEEAASDEDTLFTDSSDLETPSTDESAKKGKVIS